MQALEKVIAEQTIKVKKPKVSTKALREELAEFFTENNDKSFLPDTLLERLETKPTKRTLMYVLHDMVEERFLDQMPYLIDTRSSVYFLSMKRF